MLRCLLSLLLLAGLGLSLARDVSASPDTVTEDTVTKARLQAAVQQHIERRKVDGAILYVDFDRGDVIRLYPARTHPNVFRMGDYFVVCAGLRDETGRALPLDVFLVRRGQGFSVFHSQIDNRGRVDALIERGVLEAF